jgi:hypothetical protein
MAWYPGAERREVQPESDDQPAIDPDQFILHSIAAPWTPERIGEYWRDSTNLESHFGVGYDGRAAQYIGTETRADANASANRRSNGHGAVSVETASDLQHTDPWTLEQVETLISIGVWLHHRHGIPLRICRTWDDPGYGYHRLHPEWSLGGTACPGDARVRQFHEVIFPAIVAQATGQTPTPNASQEDTDMTPEDLINAKMPTYATLPGGYLPTVGEVWNGMKTADAQISALANQLTATTAAITALTKLVSQAHTLDVAAVGAAVQAAVEEALATSTVAVAVTVHDSTTPKG